MNVNFNGNNQSTGGGGGGDATAANQVLEIAEIQNLLLELQSFANQNNVDLTAVISNLNGSITSTNALAKEASFQKLIQVNSAAGFTNLYDLLVALTVLNTGKSTASNQTTINSSITAVNNTINTNLVVLQGLGSQQNRVDTSVSRVILCNYLLNNRLQQTKLTIQIESNVGATGTLNIEIRSSSTAPYIVIPLIDLQATFAAAYVNPPYNVAGSKIYQLDVTCAYDVRITPSVPSALYYFNYLLTSQ
ncbi:MAG: hypothetical protein RLZZ414_248 [Bacteroidota bacterium]|jgi:hypothetical protein